MDREFTDFCRKARETHVALLGNSANLAFRNLFDPYCAEYFTRDRRLDIVRLLTQHNIDLTLLAHAFCRHWISLKREDISDACFDGLARLVEDSIEVWE